MRAGEKAAQAKGGQATAFAGSTVLLPERLEERNQAVSAFR